MFKLVGKRKNGMNINKEYDNIDIARFEFDVTKAVASNLELYNKDILIDQYINESTDTETVVYLLEGETAFNNINKVIRTNKEKALIEFNREKHRCNWLVLYENRDGQKEQVELYIKGVA